MKKNQRKLLGLALAGVLTFGVFAIALGSYYTSKAYLFEKETGGHYLGEVDPEIQGIYAHKCVTPTDNYYSTQKSYSMNNVGNIESVWNEYKGNGVTIAVIDDGFDHDHPEFTRQGGGSVISNDSASFYQSDGSYGVKYYSEDPTCIDEEWDIYENEWGTHGTNVSSTALAPMGNGGVVGIAPEATLLALKIDFSFVAIRAAINYAVSHGADVINMSLGAYAEVFEDGFGDTQNEGYTASDVSGIATYLNSACNNAYNNGVIIIAAAGNEATNHKSYPACNNHVIGVGALYRNSSTTLAPFTNYITGSEVGEKNVDILAPGFVYAAGVEGADQSSHTASYFKTQGTSFSSPIIAGAAALWKEKHPTGTPDEFEFALTQSAAGIGTYTDKMIQVSMYEGYDYDVGPSNFQGGRLDVASLMAFTNEATGITVSPSSHSMPKYQHRASTYNLTVNPVPSTAELPTINWSSSNTNVATVNSSGVVTAVGAGNATITAESTDGTMSSSSAITVYDYISPTGIQITNKNVSVEVGETYTINDASVVPANASDQDIIFISNDDNIATVNDDVITGVAVGSTTVTAYALDDDADDFIQETINVTVTKPTAISGTAKYTVANTSSVNSTGAPAGSSATFANTYTTADQMTSGKSQTLTLSGYAGFAISAITLEMHSNSSKGAGSLSVKVGEDSVASLSACDFNQWYDNASFGSEYRDVHVDLTDTARVVGETEKITIVISATVNSLYCRAFSVSYTSNPPAHPISITLAENAKTIEKDATYQLTPTVTMSDSSEYTGSITYTSSNTNVATVSASGLVTAVAKGNATITVRAGNVSTSVAITVVWSNEPLLNSITVSNAPTSVPYKGTLNTNGLVVTAHYTHGGEDQNVTAQAQVSQITTDQIGPKTVTVTYTEGNIQKQTSFNVFVTNVGADHTGTEHPGDETNYGPVTDNNYFESNNDSITLGGASFTIDTDAGYFSYDASKGSQLGSKNAAASYVNISATGIPGQLTSITVYASTASNGDANISLTVGGIAFKCGGNNAVALTTSNAGYTFTGNSSGEIVIHYANNASKAVYFSKITVNGSSYVTYDWSGDEQAASFITYLQTFSGSCASGFASRDAVAGLISEYNAMIDEAKNAAIMNQTIEDLGGSVLPINKLKMMVAQYNATLEQGESLLTLNLPGGNYNGQGKAATVQGAQENDFNSALIAAVITGAALLFAVVIKRKAQD